MILNFLVVVCCLVNVVLFVVGNYWVFVRVFVVLFLIIVCIYCVMYLDCVVVKKCG